jgi:hypothetical protein
MRAKPSMASEIASSWWKMAFTRRFARFLSLSILAFLFGILVIPSVAQDPPPPWRENLDCDRAVQKYSGVEYCTGSGGNVHVLVVDLHESGVRLEYVIAEGLNKKSKPGDEPSECQDVNVPSWSPKGPGCYDPKNELYYPVMSLLDAVNRNDDAAVVINTDYGAGTQEEPKSREHGPEGFTVVRGNRIDGPGVGDEDNNAENRPWLAVSESSPLRAEFGQFSQGEDNGSKPGWVYTGVGGAPWLIDEGLIATRQISECKNAESGSCTSAVAQTAVALSQDSRWLYLVLAVGEDARGTAEFLHDTLQPWQAIKMDGGGSSQLWYGGLPGGNNPQDRVVYPGNGRRLSQYLAVFAEPGSGIIVEPAPEPPDQPGWWERIWRRIREQWERVQRRIKEWWENWKRERIEQWENWKREQIERLKRQFEEEFLRWLERQCTSAILPFSLTLLAATATLYKKRRNLNG